MTYEPRTLFRSLGSLIMLATLACGDTGGAKGNGAEVDAETALIARGKHYYDNVCIACHNGDPNVNGTLGPALAGSSLEVIQAKVMRGEYPEGYTPKRDTGTMPRFQYLEPELEGIATYLASVVPESGS